MTKAQIRQWLFNFQGEGTLCELCLCVRAAINGAADGWPKAEIMEAYDILDFATDEAWHGSSNTFEAMIDDAVRNLCWATMQYIDLMVGQTEEEKQTRRKSYHNLME